MFNRLHNHGQRKKNVKHIFESCTQTRKKCYYNFHYELRNNDDNQRNNLLIYRFFCFASYVHYA